MFNKQKQFTESIKLLASTVEYPKDYIYWPNGVLKVDDNTLTMQGPIFLRDDSNTENIEIAGDLSIDLTVDGILGINTNQFPAQINQFYNIRLLKDSSETNPDTAEFIEQNTSPALPTGYDISAVLHPGWVTLNTTVFANGYWAVLGNSIRMHYNSIENDATRILIDGNAITRTVLDASTAVPTGRNMLAHIAVIWEPNIDESEIFIDGNLGSAQAFTQQTSPGYNVSNRRIFNMDTLTNDAAEITYELTSVSDLATITINGFTSGMRNV